MADIEVGVGVYIYVYLGSGPRSVGVCRNTGLKFRIGEIHFSSFVQHDFCH